MQLAACLHELLRAVTSPTPATLHIRARHAASSPEHLAVLGRILHPKVFPGKGVVEGFPPGALVVLGHMGAQGLKGVQQLRLPGDAVILSVPEHHQRAPRPQHTMHLLEGCLVGKPVEGLQS